MRWFFLSFGLIISCVSGHWDCPSEVSDRMSEYITKCAGQFNFMSNERREQCLHEAQNIYCKWTNKEKK